MSAICLRKYFGGSRVLVASDENALAMQLAKTTFRAGATVLGPTTTLSQMKMLVSKAKPAMAVLGSLATELNIKPFMLEIFEHHLPPLFYVKINPSLPLVTLRGNSG